MYGIPAMILRADPRKDPAIRVLSNSPERVLWIMPFTQPRVPHRYFFELFVDDGGRWQLDVAKPRRAEAERVLRALCPRALFGCNPEWEEAFRESPERLRELGAKDGTVERQVR